MNGHPLSKKKDNILGHLPSRPPPIINITCVVGRVAWAYSLCKYRSGVLPVKSESIHVHLFECPSLCKYSSVVLPVKSESSHVHLFECPSLCKYRSAVFPVKSDSIHVHRFECPSLCNYRSGVLPVKSDFIHVHLFECPSLCKYRSGVLPVKSDSTHVHLFECPLPHTPSHPSLIVCLCADSFLHFFPNAGSHVAASRGSAAAGGV